MEGPQVLPTRNNCNNCACIPVRSLSPLTRLALLPPQLVRNVCAEALRRLRVTEAAAVQMLRSLRSESAEQQHRIRSVKQQRSPCSLIRQRGCCSAVQQQLCCILFAAARNS
jgi:hypothetical protein